MGSKSSILSRGGDPTLVQDWMDAGWEPPRVLHRPWLWREFPPFLGHFLQHRVLRSPSCLKGVCRRGSCWAAGERPGQAGGSWREEPTGSSSQGWTRLCCSSGTAQHSPGSPQAAQVNTSLAHQSWGVQGSPSWDQTSKSLRHLSFRAGPMQ